MHIKLTAFSRAALFAAACCLVAGCGEPAPKPVKLAAAGGRVLFNGAPLVDATVTFSPDEGPVAMAKTDLEGKFTLLTGGRTGVAVGDAKVTILPFEPAKQELGKFSKTSSEGDRQQMQERMMKQ